MQTHTHVHINLLEQCYELNFTRLTLAKYQIIWRQYIWQNAIKDSNKQCNYKQMTRWSQDQEDAKNSRKKLERSQIVMGAKEGDRYKQTVTGTRWLQFNFDRVTFDFRPLRLRLTKSKPWSPLSYTIVICPSTKTLAIN